MPFLMGPTLVCLCTLSHRPWATPTPFTPCWGSGGTARVAMVMGRVASRCQQSLQDLEERGGGGGRFAGGAPLAPLPGFLQPWGWGVLRATPARSLGQLPCSGRGVHRQGWWGPGAGPWGAWEECLPSIGQ